MEVLCNLSINPIQDGPNSSVIIDSIENTYICNNIIIIIRKLQYYYYYMY